jgi:hypothetical protein
MLICNDMHVDMQVKMSTGEGTTSVASSSVLPPRGMRRSVSSNLVTIFLMVLGNFLRMKRRRTYAVMMFSVARSRLWMWRMRYPIILHTHIYVDGNTCMLHAWVGVYMLTGTRVCLMRGSGCVPLAKETPEVAGRVPTVHGVRHVQEDVEHDSHLRLGQHLATEHTNVDSVTFMST